MVTEYTGNAIPAPGYHKGNESEDDELLYSVPGYTQKGVTLKAGQGVLLLGTPLAYETTTKRWVAAANGGANGTGTVRGFLRRSTDTGQSSTDSEFQNNIVIKGSIKRSKVVAAIAALADAGHTPAAVTTPALSAILTALNGREDTLMDFIEF